MNKPSYSTNKQRGAVLIVAMVMLVILTLIIVSSVRTTTMNEKMAGNARDRDKAFQAAEAAVQECLRRINGSTYPGTRLQPSAYTATPNWEVASKWADTNTYEVTTLTSAAGLASYPRCMVEDLNTATGSVRVTGRAVGASSDTVVMLQATYSTE